MDAPKNIIQDTSPVKFYRDYLGEKTEFTGRVRGNSMDRCMHRTLKDLVYYIIEDTGNSEELVEIHHSDVIEIIECPNCRKDLLEVGVCYPSFIIYNKYSNYSNKMVVKNHEALPVCMSCDLEIGRTEIIERLGRHFDIDKVG